jgi:polar amino acid transport system substrate-binding protein
MICTAEVGQRPKLKEYTVSHSPLRRMTTFAAAALTVGLALSGCSKSDSGSSNPPSGQPGAPNVKLVSAGKIKTCTNLPYPPFQFAKDGKTVGFDVDMIDLAAKKLGVSQEIVDVKFDVIKSGATLNAGQCDVAAAGMTITDERKQNLDFTDPYFDEVIALIVKKGSGIKSLDDVKSKNLKVGVQTGTTSLDLAKEKGFSPTEFEDSGKQLIALQSNQVDVALQDLPVVNDWLKRPELANKLELGAEISTGAQYGFAVKKGGNPELLKLLNDTIKSAIDDGTWSKFYKQWMGSDPKSKPATK